MTDKERSTPGIISLPDLISDLGYACCNSSATLRDVFAEIGVTSPNGNKILNEEDVARTISMMARTHTNGGTSIDAPTEDPAADINGAKNTWDVQLFAETLTELEPNLNWSNVISFLDHQDFYIHDVRGYEIIIEAFKYATKDSLPFPIELFLRQWKNEKGQLSFLHAALTEACSGTSAIDPFALALASPSARKVISVENFPMPNMKTQVAQVETAPWNLLGLTETLIEISARLEVVDPNAEKNEALNLEIAEMVKSILEHGVKHSPELVMLALAQVEVTSPVKDEIVDVLLPAYIAGHSSSNLVLARLWKVNPDLFISGLMEMYSQDNTSLSRVLDITQDMKILTYVLAVKSYPFVIDLAALASRREYLNLEKWLQDSIASDKDKFVMACLEFLSQKVVAAIARQDGDTPLSVPVSIDAISIFLRVLQSSAISLEYSDQLREVHNMCLQMYPRLMNLGPGGDINACGAETSFPTDIEEEANSYYERIYNGDMSVTHMVDLLQRFKMSPVPREQDTFACMVHNLFDEYRFFEKYPDQELSITAVLFGSLIQRQLVSYIPLGIALRYVLDALRKPADSKMYEFGVQALRQFQSRLGEWPQYCSHLLQILNLQQSNPEIIDAIMSAMANGSGSAPGSPKKIPAGSLATTTTTTIHTETSTTIVQDGTVATSQNMVATSSTKVDYTPGFTALNVDTLLSAAGALQFEAPPETVQDKILFIVNNIAPDNLEAKCTEMKTLLSDSAYPWFAHYIVVKRASIEPNYHSLYLQFLDMLDFSPLYKRILLVTYHNIKILLNSEKTVSSSSERSLLKNLGSWVGAMTLAKNKPIKHKNIAFKELLIEGFDNNRLIVSIPFVCKVLEQAGKSKVFKPPNPWLMATLSLLVELYHFADLKLNLKFEIEVLCKSLAIDMKDIEATSILKDRPAKDADARLALDFNRMNVSEGQPEAQNRMSLPGQPQFAQAAGMIQSNHSQMSVAEEAAGFPNLANYIVINPSLTIFQTQPALKRLVLIAVDQALREIIAPVVERSVTIASITARELIVKDFVMEPNEEKMKHGAHLMIQNLAGSLAIVTCKEPLKQSITTHLKTLFLQNGFTEATMPQQAIHVVAADNLDVACSIIEKSAMEKSITEIDESLVQAYAARKKHREQRTGQPFYDVAAYSATRYPANLPEALRFKPNSPSNGQMRVYEDWVRVPRQQSQVPLYDEKRAGGAVATGHRQNPQAVGYGYGNESYESAPPTMSSNFAPIIELEKLVQQNHTASWATIPPTHDIRVLVRRIPALVMQAYNRDEVALTYAQKVMGNLFKSETTFSREVFSVLLEKLCEISPKAQKEVVSWMIYADDDRKYNVGVVSMLIRSGIIRAEEQDLQLAKLMETGRPTVIEFTAKLIRECVIVEPSICTSQQFFNSVGVLSRISQRGKASEAVHALLEDLEKSSRIAAVRDQKDETAGLREQLTYFFAEWVRTYTNSSTNEKTYAAFVMQLQQQVIVKSEDISSLFFRVCTEVSIENYIKQKSVPGAAPGQAYQAIDAFARLIVLLIRYNPDAPNANNNQARVNLLTKIMTVIVLVLVHFHEVNRTQFNQKPFFRLFSSVLMDLNYYEHIFQPIYFEMLVAMSNTFNTLQPFFLPGFAFGWLSLISHRHFMPKLLIMENQKGSAYVQRLLVIHFRFLVPFLRNGEMKETMRQLYRGTLRVLLVLLHDFPEFLCDYHFSFCDVIPASCIQLRNLILSSFPRNMRLPDPFTPNLKVDLLPEINQSPRVLSDYQSALSANNLKAELDVYLKTRSPVPFLLDLRSKLLLGPNEKDLFNAGSKYNIPIINALVLYVGIQAVTQLQNKANQTVAPITHSAPMDIFQQLLVDLDSEGRYLFLSAIANQLRYPNSHTHYFSCVLLYLFAEANQEIIKEQITRVLLERLIVNRPHPWGLLISFVELVKNPRYDFWSHPFTRCAPDIERLFDSVARSINVAV